VDAVTYYKDSAKLVEISSGLQSAMKGLDMSEIPEGERLQERGW
jgi:pyridoxal 5'-phosphate synthase pdxS subunit